MWAPCFIFLFLGILPELVKSCLCFSLFFTYPVMMFPVVSIIESRLMPDPNKNEKHGVSMKESWTNYQTPYKVAS